MILELQTASQEEVARLCKLQFIVWGILLPIIGFFGLIGNVLTIIVLFRKVKGSPTVYFLRMLAVTDIGIILLGVLALSPVSISKMYNQEMWRFTYIIYPKLFMPTDYLMMTIQMMNVWAIVSIAIDRYIAICHPVRAMAIRTHTRALAAIAIIVLVSFLFNAPRCLARSYKEWACKNGTTCYYVVDTAYGKSEAYDIYYHKASYTFFIFICPLVLLAGFNISSIISIKRRVQSSSSSDQLSDSQSSINRILIGIVIVFALCQTSGLIAQFDFMDKHDTIKWLLVSNTLFILNSSVHFFIYIISGRRFREALLKLLPSSRCKKATSRTRGDSTESQDSTQALILT